MSTLEQFSLPPTPSAMPLTERIDALVAQSVFVRVTADDAEAFAQMPGDSVLLLTADTRNNPESWDALIILPEVLRPHRARLRAGVVLPADAPALARRFGVRSYPALIFQRAGAYVGAIDGLQDWETYVADVARLLAAPTTRIPSIGVAVVRADAGTCH